MVRRLMIRAAEHYRSAATGLACELDHPAYDGCNLALAEAAACRFVTADKR
ncbi:MAG: hypothetical protein ACRD2D_03770 [Terriglobales bacterium]